jgi:O-antigen/teichoic acid export membrane protein
LTKNEIRLQYSGLIIFAAQMLSVVTGLAFTLLLTRNMTKEEYGVWSNIFDLVGYFLIFGGLFPFWATRFVARGKEGAVKTGLLANLIFALISIAVYIPLIPIITGRFNISGKYVIMYAIASAQIVNSYLISMLESCIRAEKPQALGYGLLIEEVCKISLAYVLIVRFQQLFLGAMLSLIFGASFQIAYYIKLEWKALRTRFQWDYVREWLKGSIANLYNSVGTQIAAFALILLFLYGGQAARGDYQAATTFANIIGYSSFLAFALYPRLLAKDSLEDIASSLKTVLMFAIPMAAVAIAMSQSLLTVLNVSYSNASPVLFFLVIDALVLLLSQFYTYVLFGIENLDEKAKIPLNKLVRSKIFKVFTLPYVQAAIALPATYYVLTQSTVGTSVQAATYVAIINLATHVITFLVLYLITRKSVRIVVPWGNVAKYVLASAIAATMLYVFPHPTTLTSTFALVAAGGATCAALILAMDKDARTLVGLIWREIESKFPRSIHQQHV